MAPSSTARAAQASFEDVPEEPDFVETDDGLKHLPPVRAHAFLGLVRAGASLARELDETLQRKHELTLHSFEVLLHLAVFSPDGSLRLSQLVHQAPLSQSQVSRLAAELEKRDLVRRSTAAEDGRGVVVTITKAGRKRFREAQETHLRDLDTRLFSQLSWNEVVQLASITSKLLDDTDQPD
jgi:DNA-binding MarR family transcriptional regulator